MAVGGKMGAAVSIVVPTLREAENIPALAGGVDAALSDRGVEWELLLVDDDSQDGSEAVVAEIARHLPVRIETRRAARRDLALSVLLGMRRARFDRIVVMDADLSHPPERIVDLLAALDDGCDIVVGSRYLPGASVDPAWGRRRALVSRLGTWLARPLSACRDPLSGFFATDRRRLPELDSLRPLGYKIALELMVRGRLRVREVPIRFVDRRRGKSNLSWRTHLDFLRHLRRLYRRRLGETLRRRPA
jgi:dolichol-phosphate mannosyltransferase